MGEHARTDVAVGRAGRDSLQVEGGAQLTGFGCRQLHVICVLQSPLQLFSSKATIAVARAEQTGRLCKYTHGPSVVQ